MYLPIDTGDNSVFTFFTCGVTVTVILSPDTMQQHVEQIICKGHNDTSHHYSHLMYGGIAFSVYFKVRFLEWSTMIILTVDTWM